MNDFIRKNKIQVNLSDETNEAEHFHQDIELIYVLEGTLCLTVLEKTFNLSSEDIVVINSNDRHKYAGGGHLLTARLLIPYNMVRQVYGGLDSAFFCNSAVAKPPAIETLRKAMRAMLLNQLVRAQRSDSGQGADYAFLSSYFHLLQVLTDSFLFHSSSENLAGEERAGKRMMLIGDYIQQNYDQSISLKTLAEYLYLSEGYLSRFFKSHFQVSFSDYLKGVRLSHARNDLIYTAKPITEIAFKNGFSSVSFFNRVFKQEYNQTPSAFRDMAMPKKETEASQENAAELQKRLSAYLNAEDLETKSMPRGGKPRYRYAADQYAPVNPVWRQILNVGSTSDLQRHEIRAQIRQMASDLHFQYARFWNLFSPDMHIDIENPRGEYNFRQIDHVIDFILEIGMTPFIDLEEKTRRINQSVTTAKVYEPSGVRFASVSHWERLFRALLEHWIHRYGKEALSKWKLEVWFGGYQIDDEKPLDSFFLIFRSACQIVKQLVPEMEIGGSGEYPQFIYEVRERRVNFWKEWVYRAPKPDFVSVMSFAYQGMEDKSDHYGEKSVDEAYLLHSVERLREELNAVGWQGMKLYVTEWNRTVSDRNIMNDTDYQAAYVVKNMVDVCGTLDMAGYFASSDWLSNYYDTGTILNGGQGLLTLDGLYKPSAFAMDFLNHLYPFLVGKNEYSVVTADGKGSFAIAAHNIKRLSGYYYLTEEDRLDRNHLWKCFEDMSPLEMEIQLDGVPNGDYFVRVRFVNDQCGSIFDAWKEIDFQPDLDAETLQYFRELCKPHMLIRKHHVEDHSLTVPLIMRPNEIGITRIDYKSDGR